MQLRRVISGGQVGVDIAALRAAEAAGIATGGWMPHGFRTKAGPRPEYARRFGMRACEGSANYAVRTRRNVADSEGTLCLTVDAASPGMRCTRGAIRELGRPSLWIDLNRLGAWEAEIARIREWIARHKIETLNVAGNSDPAVEETAETFLRALFAPEEDDPAGSFSN